jgi:hypothetical protein
MENMNTVNIDTKEEETTQDNITLEYKEEVEAIMHEGILLENTEDVISCLDMMISIMHEARTNLLIKFNEDQEHCPKGNHFLGSPDSELRKTLVKKLREEEDFLEANQYLGAIDKGLRMLRKYFKGYFDQLLEEEIDDGKMLDDNEKIDD